MDDFRLVLIQVERRLSRSERERFLFIVAPYITRDEQKNSSTGGTLDVLQSLLEQERISPNDCSFLIDAFEKIECWTAANHLKNHFREKYEEIQSELPKANQALLDDNVDDSFTFKTLQLSSIKEKNSIENSTSNIFQKSNILMLLLMIMILVSSVIVFVLIWKIGLPPSKPTTKSCLMNNSRTKPPFINFRSCSRWSSIGTTILGTLGLPGIEQTQLHSPVDVVFDDQGFLYVSDKNNNRIQRFHPSQPNNVTTLVDQIHSPRQIFFHDETKTLFITQFYQKQILRWNLATNQFDQSLDGCQSCSGVFVSSDSQLFLIEKQHHQLLKCPLNADRIENCRVYAGGTNEHNQSLKNLNGPTIVTVNQQIPFVIDFGNERIVKFDPKNDKSEMIFHRSKHLPFHVLVDDVGTIYSTMCRQLPRNDSECFILRMNSDHTNEQIIINTSSHLRNPHGFTFDSFGNLYVADTENHRIVRFDVICNECLT